MKTLLKNKSFDHSLIYVTILGIAGAVGRRAGRWRGLPTAERVFYQYPD